MTNIHEEIWKYHSEYPNHQVSNLGRVKNIKFNKMLNPSTNGYGYKFCMLRHFNGRIKNVRIHKLVMQLFGSIDSIGNQVNHINGIKTDNRIDNLEWVTARQNIIHGFENGLLIGPRRKLSKQQVLFVRENRNKLKYSEIADRLDVTPGVISCLLRGKTYKHV